ncbi:hypothetical protein ACWGH2_42025 [Streptomyces sp. NPDC054871]
MGYIRIFEDAGSRSGWHSVWESGESSGRGWEAVPKSNAAVYTVFFNGEVKGRLVARDHLGCLNREWPYQAELDVDRAPRPAKVGSFSHSPHGPAEALAKSASSGTFEPTAEQLARSIRR